MCESNRNDKIIYRVEKMFLKKHLRISLQLYGYIECDSRVETRDISD